MMKIRINLLTYVLILVTFCSHIIHAENSGSQHWKSKDVLSAVALIEVYIETNKDWYPFGTGVLLDLNADWPHIFLVMNRHIYTARDSFRVQVNFYTRDDSTKTYENKTFVFSKKAPAFVPSTEDSDFVAILIKRPKYAGFNPIRFDEIRGSQTLEYGDDVEFYGFPLYINMGLHKSKFKFPLLRSGAISYFVSDASVRKLLPSMFLIDGASYGGGSGSPVFSKTLFIDDSLRVNYERKFIGIIQGHFPIHTPIEIEMITKTIEDMDIDSLDLEEFVQNVRLSTKQNSDLAIVISSDILVLFIIKNYGSYIKTSQ